MMMLPQIAHPQGEFHPAAIMSRNRHYVTCDYTMSVSIFIPHQQLLLSAGEKQPKKLIVCSPGPNGRQRKSSSLEDSICGHFPGQA